MTFGIFSIAKSHTELNIYTATVYIIIMQADAFALGSKQRQLKRHSTIKRKTTLRDINVYRLKQNCPEEALLSIIREEDRVSYPEERVE